VRRILRRIDRALAAPENGELVALADAAWTLGGAPFEDTGIPGRAVLTFLLIELVAALEAEETRKLAAAQAGGERRRRANRHVATSPDDETPLRRTLDGIASVVFQLRSPTVV
jgi:hypothetical protein